MIINGDKTWIMVLSWKQSLYTRNTFINTILDGLINSNIPFVDGRAFRHNNGFSMEYVGKPKRVLINISVPDRSANRYYLSNKNI